MRYGLLLPKKRLYFNTITTSSDVRYGQWANNIEADSPGFLVRLLLGFTDWMNRRTGKNFVPPRYGMEWDQ